jgi:CBS domain-containing protein
MKTAEDFFTRTAGDLMSREVVTLPQHMPLSAAARVLAEARVGGAPVVDGEGHCVGVLSASDFMSRQKAGNRAALAQPAVPGCVCSDWAVVEQDWDALPAAAVSRYMTADPVTVSPATPVGELARLMVDANIHRLIVADGNGRPVGIVSATDLLAGLARAAGGGGSR